MQFVRDHLKFVVLGALLVAVGLVSTAFATGLINGHNIKNGTVGYRKLSPGVQSKLNAPGPQGAQGAKGEQGTKGDQGPKGDQGNPGPKGEQGDKGETGSQGIQGPKGETGTTGSEGPEGPEGPEGKEGKEGPEGEKGEPGEDLTYHASHWEQIDRNTLEAGSTQLRGGPYAFTAPPANGTFEKPYFGVGSLGLDVGNSSSKAAFGNQVDFNDPNWYVSSISAIGFRVYTTGEDYSRNPENLPNITLEIDPNLGSTASNYSSLVFVPATPESMVHAGQPAINEWSGYIDAAQSSARWYLTGEAGTKTGCTEAHYCNLAEVQAALNDGNASGIARLYTVQIVKGRDYAWQGAVDGLRVNNTIYNFEPNGVFAEPAA